MVSFFKFKKAQVSLEFIILLVMSVFIIFTFIVIVQDLSDKKVSHKALDELDDLGKSLQQEMLLASQLEDGYQRTFYIPSKLYGVDFTMNQSDVSSTITYLNFYYQDVELFYAIPTISGNLKKGNNIITKDSTGISVTQ